jgi:hypothetical protein
MSTLNACNQPQAMADQTPRFDGQVKKGKRKMPGAVMSKKGQFYRPDLRRRKKTVWL